MSQFDYKMMYEKIYNILGDLTPLKADCGVLCDKACCKGDSNIGMRLFPHEETTLDVITNEHKDRIAVCDGKCDRDTRPLSCRIFPFFPTVSDNGKIFVELDDRATLLCPLIKNADDVLFDRKFIKAVKKIGKLLSKDRECLEFLQDCTAEIDTYRKFLS